MRPHLNRFKIIADCGNAALFIIKSVGYQLNSINNSELNTSMSEVVRHVAFGVDANYFRGMGVNIASIIKNNPGMRFVFHVFAFSVSDDNHHRLLALQEMYDMPIKIHVLATDLLNEFSLFPCFSKHSLGTFVRILIPNMLKGVTSRVLYVDADVLCVGKLDSLFETNIDRHIAAAVHDQLETTASTQISALQLMKPVYFNAGVMYINVDNWIAYDTQTRALTTLSQRDLTFADQDALNIVLNEHTVYIDEKWNFRLHLVELLSKGKTSMVLASPAAFIHFTGPVKPWQSWCLHDAKAMFIQYQGLSPWSNVPLDPPTSTRELKLYSKFLIKQGHTMKGVRCHLKYLIARMMN